MEKVIITLNVNNIVVSVENNKEFPPQYAKVDVSVGDTVCKEFLALMLMNPHRFHLKRQLTQ